MANNINWGKIYESTAWGSGVSDNSISWGKSYADLAGGYEYLLDTYSGAAAAYSLRLLDSTYSGDAIVVRRASDNTTQAIGFVDNELDTTTLESFCSGTNGFVTTWYDQSGNGNDATNASASSQPKIVSSGSTILENGKAALKFDGVDDKFIATSSLTNRTNPASFFFAGKFISSTGAFFGKADGGNRGLGIFAEGSRYRVSREGYGTNDHFTSVLTTQISLNFVMINGVSNLYENGVGIDNPQNLLEGLDFSGDSRAIGSNISSQYYDGVMQDFILYHTDESSNRSGIETNINDFYSIY